MKAEDILLALGEIDEMLPPECTKPIEKKTDEPPAPKPAPIPIETAKKKQNRRKIAGAYAACFAVVIAIVILGVIPAPRISAPHIPPETTTAAESAEVSTAFPEPEATTERPTAEAETLTEPKPADSDASRPAGSTKPDPSVSSTVPPAVPDTTCEKHNWAPATCVSPRKCRVCGATEDGTNPNNHVYVKTNGGYFCKYCGKENPNKSEGVTVENRPTSTTEPTKETTTSFGFTSPTTTIPSRTPVTPEKPKDETPKVEPPKDDDSNTPGGFATPVGGDDNSGGNTPPAADPPVHSGTSWGSKSVAEKYPEMTFNEKRYVFGSDDAQEPGAHLGALTLAGSDGNPAHALRAEIYAIPDTAPESAVLVRFPDGSFCRYIAA